MLFSSDMIEAILDGRKTRTTRPVTRYSVPLPYEYEQAGHPKEYDWAECRYKDGHTYAVQPGRGKKAVAYIRVLYVVPYASAAAADTADPEHARLEGFDSRKEFLDKWDSLYQDHRRNGPVWVIDFQLVMGEDE